MGGNEYWSRGEMVKRRGNLKVTLERDLKELIIEGKWLKDILKKW